MHDLGFPTCIGSIGNRGVNDASSAWFRELAESNNFKTDGGEERTRCGGAEATCIRTTSFGSAT